MPDIRFDKGMQHFANADINWGSANIKIAAVNKTLGGGWTPSKTGDEFLNIIPGAGIIATSANLTGKTNVGGVLDADDFAFATVTGAAIQCLVLYKDTGSSATSLLIAYFDSWPGIPFTPDGDDIAVSVPPAGLLAI